LRVKQETSRNNRTKELIKVLVNQEPACATQQADEPTSSKSNKGLKSTTPTASSPQTKKRENGDLRKKRSEGSKDEQGIKS